MNPDPSCSIMPGYSKGQPRVRALSSPAMHAMPFNAIRHGKPCSDEREIVVKRVATLKTNETLSVQGYPVKVDRGRMFVQSVIEFRL